MWRTHETTLYVNTCFWRLFAVSHVTVRIESSLLDLYFKISRKTVNDFFGFNPFARASIRSTSSLESFLSTRIFVRLAILRHLETSVVKYPWLKQYLKNDFTAETNRLSAGDLPTVRCQRWRSFRVISLKVILFAESQLRSLSMSYL